MTIWMENVPPVITFTSSNWSRNQTAGPSKKKREKGKSLGKGREHVHIFITTIPPPKRKRTRPLGVCGLAEIFATAGKSRPAFGIWIESIRPVMRTIVEPKTWFLLFKCLFTMLGKFNAHFIADYVMCQHNGKRNPRSTILRPFGGSKMGIYPSVLKKKGKKWISVGGGNVDFKRSDSLLTDIV